MYFRWNLNGESCMSGIMSGHGLDIDFIVTFKDIFYIPVIKIKNNNICCYCYMLFFCVQHLLCFLCSNLQTVYVHLSSVQRGE